MMKGSYKNLFKKLLFTLQLRCSQFVSYGGGQLLISEVIDTQGSPSTTLVQVAEGLIWKQHVNHSFMKPPILQKTRLPC